jgi:hypothetical protein
VGVELLIIDSFYVARPESHVVSLCKRPSKQLPGGLRTLLAKCVVQKNVQNSISSDSKRLLFAQIKADPMMIEPP